MELVTQDVNRIVMDSELQKSLIMCILNINRNHHIKLCSNTVKFSVQDHMGHKNMNCMVIFKLFFEAYLYPAIFFLISVKHSLTAHLLCWSSKL